MFAAPVNGLSTLQGVNYANYEQSVKPVKPAKKVEFADMMVVPVGGKQEEQAAGAKTVTADRSQAAKLEEAFNQIASSMQGQNSFYDSSMQGGSYAVVGSMFDAIA